ncbi:ATP-binding protein [Helicobacter sp. 13S00482-2]|uniref:argininosuccinate synthase domain-containing protein n=1 Tax=Helicobacter sp. 13S00482-2 TaxID=1476200 RepID=UPI000BA683FA|nr:argininosuccinate synthase domain-containing protein [Helicobacter sp. 13S00482-2]PAF53654.1 ATP-binding protein [Helicobacter sp. 13S00482-2]
MKKALALFSGGLDSMISMKLLKDQGIEVVALHFNIGFGANRDKLEYLQNASAQVGVELKICDIRDQFFNEILFSPKYGYGKFFNPCIDCHANMFAHAFDKLLELNADFVISGEVIGQRPKSQRRQALDQVKKIIREIGQNPAFDDIVSHDEKDSSKPFYLDELILRPMSAKLLEPTFPERAGWVDREKLLDVNGRGRNRQLSMVEEFGWKYYEKPGGGCLLTDMGVSLKLKDLSSHRKMVIEDTVMVKVGRYMVLENGARCIIARNDEENYKLDKPHPLMDKIELLDCVGPIGLVEKTASDEDKILAGRIVLSYGRTQMNQSYKVKIGEVLMELFPYEKEKARKFLLFNT